MKIFIKFTALGAQSEFLRLAGLGRRITLQSLYALRVIVWNCEIPERLNSFSALAEKIYFQHLIFLIFLRFGAGFWNILNFSFGSFFELGIFRIDAQASQNES